MRLELEGRCDNKVAREPELFLRIQLRGGLGDKFLSTVFGVGEGSSSSFFGRWEKLERNFSSFAQGELS